MKLTDFYHFAPLNELKARMGIPIDVYGTLTVIFDEPKLTLEELNKLYEGEGLDVSFDEIEVFDDGTLVYKGSRVLLYIRDVFSYHEQIDLPKYHVSNCTTLKNMSEIGRSHRYLISARIDGIFHLNVNRGKTLVVEKSPLNVCQNCLAALEFNGFRNNFDKQQRAKHVKAFTPSTFFEQYPRQLNACEFHAAEFAPLNTYSPTFFSHKLRISNVGWMEVPTNFMWV